MFGDADRSAKLLAAVAELDITNLPRWDDNQVSLLRNEIKEALRRPNCIPSIGVVFQSTVKPEVAASNISVDDHFVNFLRWLQPSKGDLIALCFALSYCKQKVLALAARRVLRSKLPEVNSMQIYLEIPEEIRANLIHVIQNDEEMGPIGGNFIIIAKEHYASLKAPSLSPTDGAATSKLGDVVRRSVAIVSLLEEYGPACAHSADAFRKVLASAGRLDEEAVGGILTLVNPKPYLPNGGDNWNLEVVAEVLAQECRGLNFTLVAKHLDSPRLNIRSEGEYTTLTRLFIRISGAPIPAAGLLYGLWTNRTTQFAILMLSANAPRGIVDFAPLISQEQVLAGDNIPLPPNLSWLCLPLYLRLFDLANSGLTMEVLEVLMKGAGMFPEYVCTSLAACPPEASGVRNEVLHRLLPLFTGLAGSRSSCYVVMKRLYVVNIEVLIKLCYVGFRRCKKLNEVLHIESIVKNLSPVHVRKLEEEGGLEDLLPLWCIKADRSELNMEEKLTQVLELNPKLARPLANFVRLHIEALRPRYTNAEGVLSFENCAVMIRLLQGAPSVVSVEEVKLIAQVYMQQQQAQQPAIPPPPPHPTAHPAAHSVTHPSTHPSSQYNPSNIVREIIEAPDVARLAPHTESEDVEAIANAYFQKIYTTDISVNEVMVLMRQFKSSSEKKEQEIFRCMVHNLFDEYRFFHKYPEKELQITGRLFGALVQHQLVASITLGIALRYVLEALRKDPDQGEGNDKMFRFGQIAIDQFRSRLSEWPQYCSHLIQIPHLSRHLNDLFQEAQRALANPLPQSMPPSSLPSMSSMSNLQPSSLNQPTPPPPSTPSYDYQSSFSSFGGGGGMVPPSFPSMPSSTLGGGGGGPVGSGIMGLGGGMGGSSAFAPSSESLLGGAVGKLPPSSTALPPSLPAASFSAPPSLPPASSINTSVSQIQQPPQPPQPAHMSSPAQPPLPPPDASPPAPTAANKEIERMQSVNRPLPDCASPPDNVRDQMQFLINNVAKNNVEQKVSEMRELLKPEYYIWFASFLVEKRVSSQPNLHSLYLSVLDALNYTELFKHVLDSTYYNVTKYLSSPLITTSSNERSVLRNFGVWLGQLTLARNKPLLQKRIDLKALIFWGYETGRLIAVCAFVAKVLEGVKESKVFRPPNPWLMAILGLLKELNEVEDLKLNIKFEVQALCKNINIKIEELAKSSLLHKLRMPVKDMRNPDFIFKPGAGGASGSGSIQQPSPVATQPLPPTPQPTQPTPAPLPPRPPTAELGGEPAAGASMGAGVGGTALSVGMGAGGLGVSGAVIPPNPTPHPLPPLDIVIPPSLAHPTHKKLVTTAVERGIREIITGAVERSVSIAMATTVHLVVKDLGGDVERVKTAASTMVTSLVSSLVHAICKEPLRIAISNHLRALLLPQLKDSVKDTAVIEQLIMQSAQDNLEVGVTCIEKISLERAVRDLDEALTKEEKGGNVGVGSSKLPVDLQEFLLKAPSNLTPTQLALYETFGKKGMVAGPAVAPAGGAGGVTHTQALEAYQVLYSRLDAALNKLHASYPGRELSLSMLGSDANAAGGEGLGVINGIREILTITQRLPLHLRSEVAMLFCEGLFSKVMENIGGGASVGGAVSVSPDLLKIEVCVAIMEGVREACAAAGAANAKPFAPDILLWLSKYGGVTSNDEAGRKAYRHLLLVCVRAKLLRAPDLDRYLAHQMEGGKQLFYLEVALSFIKQCMMEGLSTVYDFPVSLDTVSKMRPTGMLLKKQLQKYLSDIKLLATAQEEGKMPTPNSSVTSAPASQVPAPVLSAVGGAASPAVGVVGGAITPTTPPAPSSLYRVDPVFREQVTLLLDRFLRVHNALNDQVVGQIVAFLHQTGMLKTEEVCEKFFRVSVDVSVEACMKTITNANTAEGGVGTLNYTVIDALGRFFLLLIRLAEKDMLGIDMHLRSTLLSRMLAAILRSLVEETESRKQANSTLAPLDTRPYYRILAYMSTDLGVPDPKSVDTPPSLLPILTTYTQAYLSITPSTIPSFAFSWLQLVCKRSFLPHLLRTQKGWPLVHRLITSLLTFLAPFLQLAGASNGGMSIGMIGLPDVIKKFYKGCLKVFLVLLHDFPEFLADYHLSLSDLIPLSCTQLRNVILSAFPRSMRLPDPATMSLSSLPSLLHSELHHTPRILTDYLTPLLPIKHHLDVYMASSTPADLPSKLAVALCTGGVGGVGGVYNVSQMSALVVYVASVWVSGMQSGSIALTATTPPPYELLRGVVRALDSEGRYTMLSVMANQLRYPNAHTHLFSHILLTLFAEGSEAGEEKDEGVQEQVTRVLLERLVVHRPHPWGLLVTFMELLKNPKYAFWKRSFTRQDPELERLLEGFVRMYMGSSAAQVMHMIQ